MFRKILFTCAVFLLALGAAGCGKTEVSVSDKSNDKVSESSKSTGSDSSVKVSDLKNAEANDTEDQGSLENDNTVEKSFEALTYRIPDAYSKLDIGDVGYPSVLYLMDVADRTSFNIVAEKIPSGIGLDEYIKAAVSQTGFEYLSNRQFSDGSNQWDEEVCINPNSGQKLNQRTVIYNDVAYVFTYAAMPDYYDTHLSEFDKLIKTVQF